MLAIQVSKLPQREKMARSPTTIVAYRRSV